MRHTTKDENVFCDRLLPIVLLLRVIFDLAGCCGVCYFL
ncbi:hypothetical protein COO91_06678 [Nostoc flagelliforme CCNUN1]|uniref:Uncharacterized protein n=1 Tax=Nostoc flagelliforme CCNUN1 TaxID=2038116 RepID=A0A2K8SYZ7_9NOSO|nr:hypothetical protein COO91_06678 [Nostoc flagelliforme CCNUN1]